MDGGTRERIIRRHVSALWLRRQQEKPWYDMPIPLLRVNYKQLMGPIWLPIEDAVFVPVYDAWLI